MKFLLTGDWHISDKTPVNRTDDYVDALKNKVGYILNFATDNFISAILQPGDLFDVHNASYDIVEWMIRLFHSRNFNVPIIGCLGQHDQRYHKQGNKNTASGCFYAAVDNLGSKVISNDKPIVYIEQYTKTPIHIYGASFGEDIPKIENPSAFNILVTHRMITKGGPLWEGQEGNTEALDLLKSTKFRLIVSGDNHNAFKEAYRMRYLVNCGSLMRSKIDQKNHKPIMYVYNTETNELKEHLIPCAEVIDVFDFEKKMNEEIRDEKMERFIKTITTKQSHSMSFTENLINTIKAMKLPETTKEILDEVLASIGGQYGQH